MQNSIHYQRHVVYLFYSSSSCVPYVASFSGLYCPLLIAPSIFSYVCLLTSIFILFFLMLYSAHASDWDHFTFSQEWPQTTCILGKEEVRTQFIFKIETDMKIGLYLTLVTSGFDQMSIEYGIPWFQFPAEGTNQRQRNCYLLSFR